MYTGLLHTHSAMRYLVLAILIIAILKSIFGLLQKSNYTKLDNKLAFFSMLFVHIQIVVGFVLYFVSPKVILNDMSVAMKNTLIRFFTVEHILLMLIVGVLITIGRINSKKKPLDFQKHKSIVIYYGISLGIILVTVYWMMPQ